MNRSSFIGVALLGLAAGPTPADVQLSIDGMPPIMTQSDIAGIVYRPTDRRLEVRTQWDDLRCVLNPDGPQVTLPEPQPGDFVFALDSYDGDVLGEYVIEADGSISQLLAAIQGDPTVLEIVTSASRITNCNGSECAALVCAPGGTPVFSGGFEPIAADLAVEWETVPAGEPLDIVAGDTPRRIALTASNEGLLDATSVFVDVDVLVPGDGSIPCPTIVTSGADFSFDANCSGTWNVGDLPAQSSAQLELDYAAASNSALGASAISDAIIDAPTVADINPANNGDSIDVEVVREAELLVDAVSIPAAVLDLTAGPASINFSIAVDPARGPSDLNNQVDFNIDFPDSGDVEVAITNPDYDELTGTWTPTVGVLPAELTGTLTVNSFEPGMQNFCFGLTSATPVDAGVDVFIASDSDAIRCLDVIGPETVTLVLDSSAPASVVAGEAGAGNLLQTFTLTNNNLTFDGDNIAAELLATLPMSGVSIESVTPSVGTVTPNGGNSWDWTISALPAGQGATLDVLFTVEASADSLDVVSSGLGSLSIDPSQVLSDPLASASAATIVERNVDLVVTSGSSSSAVQPGSSLTYQFQVANVGPSDGSGIELDLTTMLPTDVTISSVTPSFQGTYSGGTWSLPSLEVGTISPTLTVVINVGTGAQPAADAIAGTVTVSASNESLINAGDDSTTEISSIVSI